MSNIKLQFRFVYSEKIYFISASNNCVLSEIVHFIIDNCDIKYQLNGYLLYIEKCNGFIDENTSLKKLGIQNNQIILII